MSRHEWVNSTLGHGVNMCRHCLMTDAEAAALGCLDTCDAERTPADAEIEDMAEKLWEAWRGSATGWAHISWADIQLLGEANFKAVAAVFRAMARVALEERGE